MAKKYRDSLFRDYFNDKIRLLSLCNALLDTDYTDPEEIVINTLEGVFFSEVKNDLSCLIQNRLIVIIEHQSTINENMPLRMYFYLNELFRKYIADKKQNIYKKGLISLPKPEFFVLYNGIHREAEFRTLRLSRAFGDDDSFLELKVKIYNINDFNNKAMIKKSISLNNYCVFVDNVTEREALGMTRKDAIEETIDYCIENNIMRDYLLEKRKEVVDMVNFEFNLRDAKEAWQEEAREEGLAEGKVEGKAEERLSSIRNIMQTLNLTVQQAMDVLKIPPEEQAAYASKL